MTELKNSVLNFFLTLSATMIGVIAGIYLTNLNTERQEDRLVMRLLEDAYRDVSYQSVFLKQIVDSPTFKGDLYSEKDLNTTKVLPNLFEIPGFTLPYPVVFERIIDDDKVFSRLSDIGTTKIYMLHESLKDGRSTILGKDTKFQEFSKDTTEGVLLSYSEIDYSVRLNALALYISKLELLGDILINEALYMKGDLTDNELMELEHSAEKHANERFAVLMKQLEQNTNIRSLN